MKKNKLIGLLATLSCVATLAGVGVANISASAETTLDGVDVSSFQMDNGASARYKAADNYTGIRFTATLDEDKYLELENKEKNTEKDVTVDYGMLIVPYDLVKTNALTPESVFTGTATGEATDTKKYCVKNHETCNCGKTHIASVEYETLVDTTAGDKVYNLRGSLVEIQEHNLTREFVGVGYIKYTVDDVSQYAFANYFGGNIENNVRSTVYVAQIALETTGDDANGTLQEKYITPFVSGALKDEFKYTVNHYLPDEKGAYKEENKKTETLYGTLNSEVAATNIAKSTLENKLDYAEYATYGFSTEQGETSGTLYANGKTVLNCYYVYRDTVLFDGDNATDFANLQTAFTKGNSIGVLTKDETYEDSQGTSKSDLTKIVMDGENNQYGAGYLKMGIADEKIIAANSANWDYLTVTMCVTTTVEAQSLPLYSRNRFLGNVPVNQWVDFVIPKATLNKSNSYVGMHLTGDFAANAEFENAFCNWYGMAMQDNQTNYSHNLFYTNLDALKYAQTGTNVTYYIEKITWGVDVTAPVISGSNAKIFTENVTVNYVPSATITDDYNITPASTFEMYSVDDNTGRTLLEAVNGSYQLTKGTDYVLVITAHDSPVSDMVGNVTTKEYPVQICSIADGLTFDSDAENGYLKNGGSAWAGVTSTVGEWENSVTFGENTANGVVSYHSDCSETRKYGGYFHLNFSEAQIADILSKFYLEDGTVNPNFKLTFNMAVSLECLDAGATVYLINKNHAASTYGPMATLTNKTWATVEISSSTLINEGWTSEENIKKYLNGTSALWYIQNDTIPANNAGALTYYFDSISWSAESNA